MFIQDTNILFYIQQRESYLSRLQKKPQTTKTNQKLPQKHFLQSTFDLKKIASSAAFKYAGFCGFFLVCLLGVVFLYCFILKVSQLKVCPMDISSFKSTGSKASIQLA